MDVAQLARAVTLVESSRADHRAAAIELMEMLRGNWVANDPMSEKTGDMGSPSPVDSTVSPGADGVAETGVAPSRGMAKDPASDRSFDLTASPTKDQPGGQISGTGDTPNTAGGFGSGSRQATVTAPPREAVRIGLSGTPGVGKSTFIETFGLMLTGLGLRVAVLAVDPSSTRSGGSILGDKTRMERLSRDPNAFIRPSPSQSHLGGVARRSREAVALCEAAGFDVVLVETVGVGQSETMVAEMTDLFILLLAPAGGDELQGVKRGIMEIADIILVNKADGALKTTATRTCADYSGALRLLRKRSQDPDGFPKAMTVSAVENTGLDIAWDEMSDLVAWRRKAGHFATARAAQAQFWFAQEVRNGLLAQLETSEAKAQMDTLGRDVAEGRVAVATAASDMLKYLSGS